MVVWVMVLNMGMFVLYDQFVEFFRDFMSFGEVFIFVGVSVVLGFFVFVCSLLFDYVKM